VLIEELVARPLFGVAAELPARQPRRLLLPLKLR